MPYDPKRDGVQPSYRVPAYIAKIITTANEDPFEAAKHIAIVASKASPYLTEASFVIDIVTSMPPSLRNQLARGDHHAVMQLASRLGITHKVDPPIIHAMQIVARLAPQHVPGPRQHPTLGGVPFPSKPVSVHHFGKLIVRDDHGREFVHEVVGEQGSADHAVQRNQSAPEGLVPRMLIAVGPMRAGEAYVNDQRFTIKALGPGEQQSFGIGVDEFRALHRIGWESITCIEEAKRRAGYMTVNEPFVPKAKPKPTGPKVAVPCSQPGCTRTTEYAIGEIDPKEYAWSSSSRTVHPSAP